MIATALLVLATLLPVQQAAPSVPPPPTASATQSVPDPAPEKPRISKADLDFYLQINLDALARDEEKYESPFIPEDMFHAVVLDIAKLQGEQPTDPGFDNDFQKLQDDICALNVAIRMYKTWNVI